MVKLRSFDAFPKLHEAYQVNTSVSNSPLTYVILAILLFICYMETTGWMGRPNSYQFEVDKEVSSTFQINLQLQVRDKCPDVSVYIQDVSNDKLFVNELVAMNQFFPNPEDTADEWCQIAGIFPTNRVRGQLTITGSQRFGVSKHFDSTHYITTLSFGDYMAGVLNSMDNVHKEFDNRAEVSYFLTIVPTSFRALGMEIPTYQFSYKERVRGSNEYVARPQITFTYDFDPIHLVISDNRMSFYQWMLRMVNIVGGFMFAIKGLSKILKKQKQTSDGLGLLDKPLKS